MITIWQSATVSNATTGLRLWTARSVDAGLTWSGPAPLRVPALVAANVSSGTHIAPGAGIELRAGPKKGRLLVVLILTSHDVLDVVLYSDDVGKTWSISKTPLPHDGEAMLAEIKVAASDTDGERSAIVFNGRSKLSRPHEPFLRGVARSDDHGESFVGMRFAHDTSSGIDCLASLLTHPANASSLLFSHPSGSEAGDRSHGVLLRSDDAQKSWAVVAQATPELRDAMFAYSSLTPPGRAGDSRVGLTYESGDPGCTASASACRIMYRELSL